MSEVGIEQPAEDPEEHQPPEPEQPEEHEPVDPDPEVLAGRDDLAEPELVEDEEEWAHDEEWADLAAPADHDPEPDQ